MGIGEILSLAAAFLWAVAILLFKVAGAGVSPFALNLFKNCVVVVLFVPTILLLPGPAWSDFSAADYLILALSGVCGITLADSFVFRSLNLIGAGRHAVVGCLFSPFVAVLSAAFLAEAFGPAKAGGFALILGGVVLVNYRAATTAPASPAAAGPPGAPVAAASPAGRAELRAGVAWGAAAMFLMALGIVMVKPILARAGAIHVAEARLVAGVAAALLWAALTRRWARLRAEFGRGAPWGAMVGGTLVGAYLAMICWILGYQHADASTAAILNQTSAVFVILLAAAFLREPLDRRRVAGALLAFAGVAVIALAGRAVPPAV